MAFSREKAASVPSPDRISPGPKEIRVVFGSSAKPDTQAASIQTAIRIENHFLTFIFMVMIQFLSVAYTVKYTQKMTDFNKQDDL